MEISPLLLSLLLFWSFVFGILLGVLNDANRIIRVFFGAVYSKKRLSKLYSVTLPIVRRPLKRNKNKLTKGALAILMFFQDIIFFSVLGIGISVLHYEFNDGKFRFFTVIAIAIGFVLYYFTVGKVMLFISEGIVFFIKAFFTVVFYIFFHPLVLLWRYFAKKIIRFLNNTIANMQKKLYNINVKKSIDQSETKE